MIILYYTGYFGLNTFMIGRTEQNKTYILGQERTQARTYESILDLVRRRWEDYLHLQKGLSVFPTCIIVSFIWKDEDNLQAQ